jgi:pimeloyl-ACP methyl ester carboxylesterase
MISTESFSIPTIENGLIAADLHWDETYESMPLVVFCHGYKGFKDWGCWNQVAGYFASRGIMFLKFNFSLNGTTLENMLEFGDLEAFARNTYSRELADLNAVIHFVDQQAGLRNYGYNGKDVFLIGHSRGGGIVMLSSGNHLVKKIITWASVSDFESRFPKGHDLQTWKDKGILEVYNARTGQIMSHNISFYEDFQANRNKLDISARLASIDIPFLIVHAEDDEAVTADEALTLNAKALCSDLLLLDEGGHTFGASHPWTMKEIPAPLRQVCDASISFLFGESINHL